ncbi:hypothetical protein SHIRM173S_12323 [Streptomyces hirsutus]
MLRQEADPEETGLDRRRWAGWTGTSRTRSTRGGCPDSWCPSHGGRIAHLTAYGRRDVAAGLPVESDTLWRIYSMTKPVTAVAALTLVEEGRLSLDDPLQPPPAGVRQAPGVRERLRRRDRRVLPRAPCSYGI